MSKIEQLVPSLELCQRAQGLGWKKETYFVWLKDGNRWHAQQPTLWHAKHSVMIPAPTLQEVLEEGVSVAWLMKYTAEEALEVWCELEERKVKHG